MFTFVYFRESTALAPMVDTVLVLSASYVGFWEDNTSVTSASTHDSLRDADRRLEPVLIVNIVFKLFRISLDLKVE